MNIVDVLRPQDPIPLIANYMLNNKHTMKNLEQFIKDLPKNENELLEEQENKIENLIPNDEIDVEIPENH